MAFREKTEPGELLFFFGDRATHQYSVVLDVWNVLPWISRYSRMLDVSDDVEPRTLEG